MTIFKQPMNKLGSNNLIGFFKFLSILTPTSANQLFNI